MSAIVLGEIFSEQHRDLEAVGQLVGAMTPGRMRVEKTDIVEPTPVRAHAVALHHELRRTFRCDREPYGRAGQMHRYGNFLDGSAEVPEQLGYGQALGLPLA